MLLRGRIKELLPQREFLDAEEEYPLHSIVTNSEEEHQYTMFSLRHNLYLNLCGFCKKCDYAVGDKARFSRSSMTIHPQQKKRYTSLSVCFNRLGELFRTGRFLLTDAVNCDRRRGYAEPADAKPGLSGYTPGTLNYYLLRNAFLHGWSLWDSLKDYLELYWGEETGRYKDLSDFFLGQSGVRESWCAKKSPSLHAVYDLYRDCLNGRYKNLFARYKTLSSPVRQGVGTADEKALETETIELYRVLRHAILYLGIMHERNEFQNKSWDFPRPLYNFFITGL